jgi:hypothetical protein
MASWTRFARLRTLVMSVMAILSVMQIALVQTARDGGAAAPRFQNGEIVAVDHVAEICRSDAGDAPADNCPHGARCVLCAHASRILAIPLAWLRVVALLIREPTLAAPPGWPTAAPIAPPEGWASSWSSRAPPFFS